MPQVLLVPECQSVAGLLQQLYSFCIILISVVPTLTKAVFTAHSLPCHSHFPTKESYHRFLFEFQTASHLTHFDAARSSMLTSDNDGVVWCGERRLSWALLTEGHLIPDLLRRQEELRRMEELHNQEMQKRKQMELRQEEERRRREEEMRMHNEEIMRRQQEFKGNLPGNVSRLSDLWILPCFWAHNAVARLPPPQGYLDNFLPFSIGSSWLGGRLHYIYIYLYINSNVFFFLLFSLTT